MLKAEMLEAIFVAGGVLAGMSGASWIKDPSPANANRLIKVELVRRMMDHNVDPVSAKLLWRAFARPER